MTEIVDRPRFATPGANIGLFCSTPMVAGLDRPEAAEGIATFLTKRPARWSRP